MNKSLEDSNKSAPIALSSFVCTLFFVLAGTAFFKNGLVVAVSEEEEQDA